MHPKMRNIVKVVPYDPAWKEEFQRVYHFLMGHLKEYIISIDHVGSTSIEGMPAKPILDIDIVIDSYDGFPPVLSKLESLGFVHEGNEGVEGREVFHRTFFDEFMAYHLYVTPKDARPHIEHLRFREYMRNHPDDAKAYGEIKQKLAQKYSTDIDGYFLAKCQFVNPIMEKIRMAQVCT
ncbi:MAG: GrpB family protein [Oscillospiraceae bacterium]|nr:GrpB family protein [Oscillospiraceae bacterium]